MQCPRAASTLSAAAYATQKLATTPNMLTRHAKNKPPTTITVNAKMPNDLAYTITKTLNDNPDRVRKIHGSLADYDPAKAYLYLGVPLHPGAERYYREKGYLK